MSSPKPHSGPSSPDDALEQRLIKLESLAALQDDLLDQLNALVYQQQQSIEQMNKKIKALQQALQNGDGEAPEDKRPPHY